MAFASGTFSRLYNWATDKANSVKITASRMDAEFDGIATGLSTCVLKDGTQTTTAVVPFAAGLSVATSLTSTASNLQISGTTGTLTLNGGSVSGVTTLNTTGTVTAGPGTGTVYVLANGGTSGVTGGGALAAQAGSVNVVAIGTRSSIAGGAFDATPYLQSQSGGVAAPLTFNNGAIFNGAVSGVTTLNTTNNVSIATANPTFIANKAASGGASSFYGQTNSLTRWIVSPGDTTAESGSNAGSDFSLYRYNDAGTLLGTPLSISRATGLTTLTSVNVTGALGTSGLVSVGGTLGVVGNASFNGTLGTVGNVGFNGAPALPKPTLPAAATDLASVITLANSIRSALINYGLAG